VFIRSLLKDILTPPHRLLPLAVFTYAMLCFIVHPEGALRTGHLADPDDTMRLNEVINWLQGQGWHDLSHPRLSPGAHTVVHWARLLDVPLALLMLPFIKLMGMQNAALLASLIVPPATFGLLLWLAVALAKIFVGAERANLAAVLVLFAPLVLMNFAPGRVDHHGYEILVAGFGLLCLERMAEGGRTGNLYAVAAAVVFACGLWIGTEALPWVILFIACLAAMAAWSGEALLRRAALFGAAFALSTLAVLPLAVAPADYSSLALSWFSPADVVFASLVAGMFVLVFLIDRICSKRDAVPLPSLRARRRAEAWAGLGEGWLSATLEKPSPIPSRKNGRGALTARVIRILLMIVFGSIAAALFCSIMPDALRGPFADYDNFDSTIALASIGEAQPLLRALRFNPTNHAQIFAALINVIQLLLLPCAALFAVGIAAARAAPRQRGVFLAHGLFLAVAIALALFWQMRIGWFMQFFTLAPLTYLLVMGWKKIANAYRGRIRFWAEIGAFLSLGFIPAVLVPALAHNAPLLSDVVLFPAARAAPVCPLRPAADFLNAPWGYGDRPHTILSGANEGPELLFRTQHNVIAANFNVAGNEDVYNFFGARDDDAAQNILKRWHADLVLVCRSFPLAYARLDHAHLGTTMFLGPAGDGRLHLVSDPDLPTLIERLVRGPVPSWLKPVEIPGDKDYLLFEVR
jgi:hypothetical protein